jgi:hypothetical protein
MVVGLDGEIAIAPTASDSAESNIARQVDPPSVVR